MTTDDLERIANYCAVCGGPHRSHLLGRLRWAARTARHAEPISLAARCRLLWHDFVIHGLFDRGTERCQDCGRAYSGWRAKDGDWQKTMGGPSGLLCARCFHKKLSAASRSTSGGGSSSGTPSGRKGR